MTATNLTILQTSGLLASSTTTRIGSDADPGCALAEFPPLPLPLLSQAPKEPVDLIFASPPFPLEAEDENKAEISAEGDSFDNGEVDGGAAIVVSEAAAAGSG